MDVTITTIGALIGLVIAIVLIVMKITPAYSMMVGALLGGLIGGAGLLETTQVMIAGTEGMVPTILRIVTAGILAGVLIESGAAQTIANSITRTLGEKRALLSLALATGVLTAIGVFGDVAVITVAPIALALGNNLGYSSFILLLALMGGEKAGMVISPNPQTIAIAEGFGVDLITLMIANIVPAIFGIIATVLLAKWFENRAIGKAEKGSHTGDKEPTEEEELPSLLASLSGPIAVVLLLVLSPLVGLEIDPLIALPAGGLIGALFMGEASSIKHYMTSGLAKMMPVAVLLVGTGTLAGVIEASQFATDLTNLLASMNIPGALLAPISTIFLSGATSSASGGAAIAATTFNDIITMAVTPLSGAAMMHTGTIVLDHLPHGSIFHSSAGVVNMSINERLKLVPVEALIGLIITIVSVVIFTLIV